MALNKYRSKRNFKTTPEPPGSAVVLKEKSATAGLRFVIQLHDATRKHYDLRLELDGTMKSWAVPKGPSLDPMERRLAVEVEDHPMEYNEFEGVIPKGHYGAGVVMIWDEGLYRARSVEFPAKDDEDALRRGFAKGHMTFILEGKKLQGEFALIRLAKGDGHSWLLVKKRDAHSTRDDITFADRSVRSGRTLGDIAVNAQVEGKIWDSRPKKATPHLANANPPLPKGESKALAPRFKKGAKPAGDPKTLKLTLWHPAKADDDGNGLIFHPLYDGYHVLVIMRPQCAVQLSSRTGLSLTKRFSKLAEDLAAVQRSLVLDGLVVPLDAEGQPRGRGRLEAHAVPHYALFVYDLLEADGLDLRHLPLKERLAAFKQINVTTESLRATQAMSPEDRTGAAAISYGALLRALDEAYGGPTSPKTRRQAGPMPKAQQSVQPLAAPGSRYSVIPGRAKLGMVPQLSLTNLQKIYWPKEKITKGDLIEYYRFIAPYMLPHLRDRPQSLNRHPNGIAAASFFQKEVSGQVPGWMETATIISGRSGKSLSYALCQNESDLLFLANLGCIEINTWLSRISAINQPDYIVFDLDPGAIPFDAVIETALTVRSILDEVGGPGFCKTSGSRGLHIYVPVTGVDSFDDARLFAHQLSLEVNRRLPATTSLERSPERRTKKIYLDYLQNRIGQTMAAVYSVRPKPNATVSTPLRWSELKPGFDPTKFTIASMPKRLARLGDLWLDMAKTAVPLNACQQALDLLVKK